MAIATNILQCLIPISQFNKGQASKIFDRLHDEKELIVLKNNQPSAVILSPEEYTRLTEIEEDYYLLIEVVIDMCPNLILLIQYLIHLLIRFLRC